MLFHWVISSYLEKLRLDSNISSFSQRGSLEFPEEWIFRWIVLIVRSFANAGNENGIKPFIDLKVCRFLQPFIIFVSSIFKIHAIIFQIASILFWWWDHPIKYLIRKNGSYYQPTWVNLLRNFLGEKKYVCNSYDI